MRGKLIKKKIQAIHVAIDPVCGMTVDEKTSRFNSVHEGKTFYFCSPGCKQKFDANPHRYGHPPK